MIKKRLTNTSDEESTVNEEICPAKKKRPKQPWKQQTIVSKILNRSATGNFNGSISSKSHHKTFKLDQCLKFCLKDIVPFRYLNDHIFMGLTSCGNFLISYKRILHESSINYDFNTDYKYELFFWIYRPHMSLNKYVSNINFHLFCYRIFHIK